MKYLVPLLFALVLCGGLFASCKHNPVGPKQDTTKCDTCKDTTHVPCDTCKHDTTTKTDTTSHNFSWTQSAVPNEAGLTGCWVFGATDVYVVGGAVYKSTDGKSWKDVSPSDTKGNSLSGGLSGYSMFAFAEDDYWLVHSGIIFHVFGPQAQDYRFGPSTVNGPLHTCWGTNSNDMYAVGDGGTILHFDGGSWTKMPSGTTKDIGNIWGTSDQNIWAAGWNVHTNVAVLLHYDGTSWQEVTQPNSADETIAVWTCDTSQAHNAYCSGSYFYHESGGNPWSVDTLGNSLGSGSYAGLNVIRGNRANDIFVEGAGGYLAHWSGKSWITYKQFFNFYGGSHDAYNLSVNGNTVCMVGVDGGAGWVVIGQR